MLRITNAKECQVRTSCFFLLGRLVTIVAGAGGLTACQAAPDPHKPLTIEPGTSDYCSQGVLGPALFFFCDLRGRPIAYRSYMKGGFVPREEVMVRRQMNLGVIVLDGGEHRPELIYEPYIHGRYDVAGWRIYDASSKAAMITVGVNGWLAVTLTQQPASGLEELDALMDTFDFGNPELVLEQARSRVRNR